MKEEAGAATGVGVLRNSLTRINSVFDAADFFGVLRKIWGCIGKGDAAGVCCQRWWRSVEAQIDAARRWKLGLR